MSSLPRSLPDPVLPVMTGGSRLRWGVLAPGFIAGRFTHALHTHTDQRVVAVGSRRADRAEEFGREYGVEHAYGSYDQLVSDSSVDAVYIAPPHARHHELALLAIAAGKHVLVEKPLAVSAQQAREITEAARHAGVFAMEAMHTRFHPRMTVIQQLLRDGVLGEIRTVTADLGLAFEVDHSSRLYDPALGGGALLDLGVYPVWFATFVLGVPTDVVSFGSLTETGVDAQSVTVLTTEAAQQAVVTTSMLTFSPSHASVNGTAARIHVDTRHPGPGPFTLYGPDNGVHLTFTDRSGIVLQDGLSRQAAWMAQHIADGHLESPMHPLSRSIETLEIIDIAREQLGVAPIEPQ